MGTLGTFDSFTTARLGIYAAQHGLRVTGNNISNINTVGYTRQRIDQVSFKTGASDRYASMLDNHVGSGALVTGINQIRDPFLDIRYRNTATDTAYYDTKLSGLQQIGSILDEVGKGENKGDGLLFKELQDLADKLRALGDSPTVDNDTLVRGAAEAITNLFNTYAGRLEALRVEHETAFDTSVKDINQILTNIRDLNKSIRECEIHGDNALELRDERNLQIDKLAEYMSIKVEYSYEDVGAGIQVEKLTIYMGNSNPDPDVTTDSSMLVDGLYATQLSEPEQRPVINPYLSLNLDKLTNEEKAELEKLVSSGDVTELNKLKNYLFLAKVDTEPPVDSNPKFDYVKVNELDDDGNPTGKTYFLVGTNDPNAEDLKKAMNLPDTQDIVIREENNNFTIQLGKLLDVRGEEWKKETTTWEEVQGDPVKSSATYEITISGKNLKDGDTFGVAGKTFTVGVDITYADTQNPDAFAAFVAGNLTNADYTISASTDGSGKIIFTANTQGAIGGDGPSKAPTLSVNDPDGTGLLTIGTMTNTDPGIKYVRPAGAKDTYEIDPRTGTETSVIYKEMSGKWYKITVVTEHTREVALDDNDLDGKLQAEREFLTEEGEFASAKDIGIDENAAIKRGIKYYQQAFDLLAQNFAKTFNDLNQGYALNEKGNYIDTNGNEIMMELDDGSKAPISKTSGLSEDQSKYLIDEGYTLKDINGNEVLDEKGNKIADVNAWLADQNGTPRVDANGNPVLDENGNQIVDGKPDFMGGPLFSNSSDGNATDKITASNISVSYDWSHKLIGVVPKFEKIFADEDNPNGDNQTTQSTNINHMITMMWEGIAFRPQDLEGSDAVYPSSLFTGSFNDMFSSMMGTQAEDARVTNVKLNTSYTTLVDLDTSREGVSGVDLNDEAMNMVQYQKAMNAAMRLMTVIDSVLDRLINNTGVTV